MTTAPAQSPPTRAVEVGTRARWATLIGVLLAFASVPMALSGTTIAVPAIARELDGGGFALSWVVSGYFLTASALMLVAGALADLVGRRRVFAIGAGCFGTGALGSALSTDIVVLDLTRTLSGVGSACLMAAGGAMLGSVFTGQARTRVFAAVGTMVGAGLALGPALAGLIIGQFGWRSLFGTLAVVAVVLLIAVAAMPTSSGEQGRLDRPSALTYVAGLVTVMVGVLQATDHGWTDARVVIPVAAGLAALVVFARRQPRLINPLVDLSLLADRHVSGWLLAGFTLAVGTLGALTYLPVFLQATGRFTPETAGALMLALTLPILCLPPLTAALVERGVPSRSILVIAVVSITAGNLLLSRIRPDTDAVSLTASLLLIGGANGILTGLIDPQTLARVPGHRFGMTSGLLNTVRAAGNTLTLAVFAAILITQISAPRRTPCRRSDRGGRSDRAQPNRTLRRVAAVDPAHRRCRLHRSRRYRRPPYSSPSLQPTQDRAKGTSMSTHHGSDAETAVLRYTIKAGHLEQHLQLLRAVYAELTSLRPARFTWSTYQIPGSRDFIEVASGHPLPGPLPDLPAFQRYRAELDDRCETRHFDDVTVIGSFPQPEPVASAGAPTSGP